MRSHPTATVGVAIVATATLLLTGCSTGASDGEATPSSSESSETSALPVGSPFGPARWSVTVDASTQQTPLVMKDRVVALHEGQVKAWNTDGSLAWEVPIPSHSEDAEIALRQIDAKTAAVITIGKSDGSGIEASGYAAHVKTIKTSSGDSQDVAVAGSESDGPKLSRVGVGFTLPDHTGVTVSAEGHAIPVPNVASSSGSGGSAVIEDPIVPIGDSTMWSTVKGKEEQYGYDSKTWKTGDLGLVKYALTSTVEGVDPILGRVVVGAHGSANKFAVVNASNGKIESKIECKPSTLTQATSSPNGTHSVLGPLQLSEKDARCVGGGKGQQDVTLTAVADDGTAYGRTSKGDLIVVPDGEGEPRTTELPDGANPPIGMLEGGLAVHYDSEQGVVTANPRGNSR